MRPALRVSRVKSDKVNIRNPIRGHAIGFWLLTSGFWLLA